MKTRLSAMAAAISSISMLAACGGGPGSFTPDAPTLPAAPTVSVNAPATTLTGSAFDVTWTSTNATSCSSNELAGVSAASGTVHQTETAPGNLTYTITCEGAGGSVSGSAEVQVNAAQTAEGLWQGTTRPAGSNRALSGVVTKEGDYWLTLHATADVNSNVVGFYAGHANSTVTTATEGTFTSSDLREATFGASGTIAAGAISMASYTAKSAVSGSFDPVTGGLFVSASGLDSVTSVLPPLSNGSGSGTTTVVAGSSGALTVTVNWSGQTTILNTNVLAVDFSDVITGTLASGVFTATGGHTHINSCSRVSGNDYCSSALSPAESTFTDITGGLNIADGNSGTFVAHYSSAGGSVEVTYNVGPLNVILSNLPSITADTFSLSTYNPAYEMAPALAALADNYSGTGSLGTTQATNSTFNINASGAVSGAEGGAGCSYTGTAAIHAAGGNVYDVTISATGCAAAGDYAGVAIYNATTDEITVTALNAARDQGFIFVGTGAVH